MSEIEQFTLGQNYASFEAFLNISSCINSSKTSQLSSFLAKLCKRLDEIETDNDNSLLTLFRRHIATFIYENVYCDIDDKDLLYCTISYQIQNPKN